MIDSKYLYKTLEKDITPEKKAVLEEICALAKEVKEDWDASHTQIQENKRQRNDQEQLTDEEKDWVSISSDAQKELDKNLSRMAERAETAEEILEQMLPLYEDEYDFWHTAIQDPKNIHPDDKATMDPVLEKLKILNQKVNHILS